MTLAAYTLMLTLFTCELQSFLDASLSSALMLDHIEGPQLQINFDIDMYDIGCRNLEVMVIDEMGQSPIKLLEKHYELHTIDKTGRLVGMHSTKSGADLEDEETAHQKLAERLKKEDSQEELDSDWADSHDGFKHQSFEHVLQFHDFTVINFFADWCVHCRQFSPMWKEISAQVKGKTFVDRAGKPREVVPIKLNCVDFMVVCKTNGIDAFPTIRLYKSDASFVRFNGHRTVQAVTAWINTFVATQAYVTVKHHKELETGCNVNGYLQVPRVPGRLELAAGNGDQTLDPTLTNVSHLVKRLYFSDARDGLRSQRVWPSLPHDAQQHLAPLNGRHFCTQSFHEAYEHHLRVVSTVTPAGVGYQFSHYGRTARQNVTVLPQARFFYDLEPFSIRVQHETKPWYNFITSLLAILGGIFVFLRLATMVLLAIANLLERSAGRSYGGGRGGADGLLT